MESGEDIVGKFVNWRDEAKKPCKKRANSDSSDAVPKEEHKNAALRNGAFFPGDFRMENVGKDSSEGVRNNTIEPK